MASSGSNAGSVAEKAVLAREQVLKHVARGELDCTYVFELTKGARPFGLDIATLLACIALSEAGRAIPAMPESWWAYMCESISRFSWTGDRNPSWDFDMARLARYFIIDCVGCWESGEDYVFDFSLSGERFAIGLRTILACLAFAEREGVVKALPPEWWGAVQAAYGS